MFDDGILPLIKDSLIDKARNAITLSIDLHRRFGNFEVYFEPTSENLHKLDSVDRRRRLPKANGFPSDPHSLFGYFSTY